YSVVTLTKGAAANTTLNAGSLAAGNGSLVLFRGDSLGSTSAAGLTPGTTNIVFASAPALVGGGADTAIIPYAFGDSTASGNGSSFVTYDANNGVRLLSPGEYANNLTSGPTSNANITSSVVSGGAIINSLRMGGNAAQVDATGGLTIAGNAVMAADGNSLGIN